MTIYAQLSADGKIINWFPSPQDPVYWPNLVAMEDEDPRFLAWLNPPPDVLALQNAKLLNLTQLASAQKVSLANRIGTLNDSVELEMATPEEIAELPVRTTQLKQWKTYAVLLGRVTSQAGWPPDVQWPEQPAQGMDLTVSSETPSTV